MNELKCLKDLVAHNLEYSKQSNLPLKKKISEGETFFKGILFILHSYNRETEHEKVKH